MNLLNRQGAAAAFLYGLLALLLYLAGRMLEPFFNPALAALTAVIVCYPLHRRIIRLMKGKHPTLQSLLTIALVTVFLITPLLFIVSATVSEARAVVPEVQAGLKEAALRARAFADAHSNWRERLPPRLVERLESGSTALEARVQGAAEGILEWVAGSAAALARDILGFIIDLAVFLFFLFFFFRDGESMYRTLSAHLPMAENVRRRVVSKIQETVIGVVRGSVLTSLIQGLLGMIGYFFAGTRAAVLLGCMTALAGFIPGVGTALVWAPLCGFYLLTGAFGKAMFLLVWGVLLGGVDNVLRPFVVGGQSQMSFFWLTLALLGGLAVFGVKGLLIGPLAFALLPILLELSHGHAEQE